MSIGIVTPETVNISLNASDYLNKKVAAIISPKHVEGINGWVFDIPKSEQVKISNDITDHYMENGSFINDHVVRKPIKITLTGFIGELVYRKPTGYSADLNFFDSSLSVVDAYLGDYSPQQLQKQQNLLNEVQKNNNFVQQVVQKTTNIVKSFSGEGQLRTMQEVAYNDILGLMNNNQLLKVQTPFAYFESMLIEDVTFMQDQDSDSYCDISVTLKEARFAETTTVAFDQDLLPSRNTIQEGDESNNGTNKGNDKLISFAKKQGYGKIFGKLLK